MAARQLFFSDVRVCGHRLVSSHISIPSIKLLSLLCACRLQCVQRIEGLTNWLVVAIDQELANYCKEHGINHYYRPVVIPDSQKDTGSNHAISAMKYEIIREFLQLGWDVLLR
jgi:hypothetical protein